MTHGVLDFGPHPPVTGLPPLPAAPQSTASSITVFENASRTTLNDSAQSAQIQQATIAAENAVVPVIYGRDLVGARIAAAVVHNGNLVLLCIWCHGEVDSIESVLLNDAALPATITATHYTGTQTQNADATLVAAFAAQSPPITYSDTLRGVCCSVFTIPPSATQGFPIFKAIIKGLKIYDPRTTTTVWSDNPALALADFTVNTTYGIGRAIDYSTVTPLANVWDTLVGVSPNQEKRRTLNLTLGIVQDVASWIETLRTYAGCWVLAEGPTTLLVADRPASSVADFTHDSGTIIELSGLKKRGSLNVPTVMEITYTDTINFPWKDARAIVYAAGVLAGTMPRRESAVSLPGIHSYSQALREATERLNKLTLNDLFFNLTVFDDGLKYQVGDVIRVSHPIGLALKPMRIAGIAALEAGRWQFSLAEYDPAVYSDAVTSAPTYADTDLPNPANPPALTGLAVSEEVYQKKDGTYSSRIRATWNAAVYPYLSAYRAELLAGGILIDSTTGSSPVYVSPAIREGDYYTARAQALTSIAAGAFTEINITAQGKQLVPGNVTLLAGFEVGGDVYLDWSGGPAVDIDIWRYEVRYGATTATWDTATLLDKVDALRYISKGTVPAGTWRFFVKAIDSVRQYSPTAAYVDVVVTLDANALQNSHAYTSPATTNMSNYISRPDPATYYVSDFGDTWAALFPNAMSTYTNALATYHTSGTSTWLSESYDFGYSLTGDWKASATYIALSGTATISIGLSPDGTTWTYYSGGTVKTAARFARIKIETTTTGTLYVVGGTAKVEINAQARKESGTVTIAATGITTITLAGKYAVRKSLQLTPVGSANARTAVANNIIISTTGTNSLDPYLFENNARVAGDADWIWEGI